jgi:hypothetical protein
MTRLLSTLYRDWIAPVLLAGFLPAWTLLVATFVAGEAPFQSVAAQIAMFAAAGGGAAAMLMMLWTMSDRAEANAAMSRWAAGIPEQTRLQKALSTIAGAAFLLAMPQVTYEFDIYSELLRDHAGLTVTPWTTLFALCLVQLVFGLAQNFSGPRRP